MIKYGHQGVSCRFLFYDPRKRINVVKSHTMDSFQPAFVLLSLQDHFFLPNLTVSFPFPFFFLLSEPNYIFMASTRSGQLPVHDGTVHFLMYFEDLLQKGDAIMAYYRFLWTDRF